MAPCFATNSNSKLNNLDNSPCSIFFRVSVLYTVCTVTVYYHELRYYIEVEWIEIENEQFLMLFVYKSIEI